MENTCVLGREKLALRAGRGDHAGDPFSPKRKLNCSDCARFDQFECPTSRVLAAYLTVGVGCLWPCWHMPSLWAACSAPWPRLPDFGVASFWWCSARVVTSRLYPLTFAPGPWMNHEGGVGLSGCLPETSSLSGLVKTREFRRRIGGQRRWTFFFSSSPPSPGREPTEPLLRHFVAPAVPDIVLRLCLGRRLRPISTNRLSPRGLRGLVTRVRVLFRLRVLLTEKRYRYWYIVLL